MPHDQQGSFGKARFLAMILGSAMSFLAAEAFAQGLEGTGHDFSSLAWSRDKTCTVCHDPSSQWGHALSSQVYTLSNSSTLDAPDHGQPSGVSTYCLGCHDGTVALDSFGGRIGSTFISPAVRLGSDLSTHHPVSFTFDSILAAVDGKLRDPSTAPSGLGGTIAEDLLDCDGKVECTTCHSLHWDAGNERILIKPVETLCLTCHSHGDTPGDHFPGGENPWGSCSLCHGEDLQGDLGPSCMDCHNDFVYPSPPQLGHHNPGRDAPYANGCTDCHNTDLQGGIGPSCFTCHEKLWVGNPSDAVPPSNHTEVKAGFAQHKPGFGDPTNNGCTLCHGANLNDGFAPSCTTCHEPIWKGAGPPSDHTEVRNGFADHKPGMGDPIGNGCTQCHGPNLDDGFAFSCTACHEPLWKGSGPPSSHTEVKGGFADHMPGAGDPIANGCTQCHGPNLDDGFAFSCTACHEPLWKGSGPPSNHTEVKGGFADHKPGAGDPIANGCTQCHGPNLNDGFAFSCTTCHEPLWKGSGPPSSHTELKGGFAEHKPGAGDPIANGCTQCHGPNLNDGFAFSCTTCHGEIWAGSGPPPDHTEVKGGFAEHKPGFGDPMANGCTQCHGPNLDDGFAPSCTTCHEPLWKGSGPPSSHTVVKAGFADHQPGLDDPIANGCTQCHGPNLDDGFAFSCFACHGELWDGGTGGNQPPNVDAGGPYAAAVGATVEFNASATVDPDGDRLTYEWDFGDGAPTSSPSQDPTATHAYAAAGTYTARLSVSDEVNTPVVVDLVVEITDSPPPLEGDTWSVMLPFLFREFTVEFEDFSGFLLVRTTQTDGQISFGIGIEFDGVIFWMETAGSLFFGNMDRQAGTAQGILFDLQGEGSSLWFAERL